MWIRASLAPALFVAATGLGCDDPGGPHVREPQLFTQADFGDYILQRRLPPAVGNQKNRGEVDPGTRRCFSEAHAPKVPIEHSAEMSARPSRWHPGSGSVASRAHARALSVHPGGMSRGEGHWLIRGSIVAQSVRCTPTQMEAAKLCVR